MIKSNKGFYGFLFVAWIVLVCSNSSFAQQYIDPALSGSFSKTLNPSFNSLLEQGEGDASLLYRHQWVGMEGAPKSIWFNANMALGSQGIVLGINAKQFKIGVEQSTEASANFTKTLRISESEYLGLGVNLGYTQQRGDYSSLDPSDPAFGDMQYGTLLYGLSASLVRPGRYYVGFAMPRAIFGSNDSDYVRQFGRDNTFYVSAAAIFDLDENIYIRPNLLSSYREVTGLQFDFSALIFFTPNFGIGGGYRQRGDLMGHAEFNLKNIRFAYSYQQNLKNSELNRFISNSTHELGLSIQWGRAGAKRL
ncbi:PorP/SprF family type IX secretion system membrane protein [Sphingobacterium sp. UT-1RO-CII-1]|uniref:PorP/SprF family type IX secretion system membrane protein n=1 Tax=Sphingobacterium sp. UT-1RO-CII-1 TaxID=2995225 RepID=UPI00227BB9ED|nr:PorP/SprF family type IX secretion system membrane protein [Sphingobacterium sp. UT-1RO-CII-1]MCY4780542.1 PorP/SprF family type IX secretion system membrane protein [Sphingobacterium sp. UT-1RO-CII-1]